MKKVKKAETVKVGKSQQRFVFKKLNKQLISVSAALVLLTANYGIAPLQAFATETATTEEIKLPEESLSSASDPLPSLSAMQATTEETVVDEGTMETAEAPVETGETLDSSEEKSLSTLQIQPRAGDWVTTELDANTVMIKSYSGNNKIITIPAEIDGKAVVVDLKNLMRSKLYQTVEEFTIEDSGGKTPVKITGNLDMLFNNSSKLRTASFGNADTSEVTTMSSMFAYCHALTALDIRGLDTSRVTKMDRMFSGCDLLTGLDLSHFDTSQVTTMDRMFSGCYALNTLNISNFNTSQVTTMIYMFSSCKSLTSLDVSSFNTGKVKKMDFLFSGCVRLTSLDITNFDTSQVTSMRTMFSGCSGLIDLDVTQLNTSQVTTMETMFSGCSGLTSLDVSQLDTSNVSDMTNMFSGCKGLSTIDISTFNTGNLRNVSSMFSSCESIETFVFPDLDTSKLLNTRYMFSSCTNLKYVDLTNLDTSQVIGMNDMFRGCVSLETLDLSGMETSQVDMMSDMFRNCTNLKELNLSNFDTTNVTDMTHIFDGCENLKKLTISPMFQFKDQHDLRELPQGLPIYYWVREDPKEVYHSTSEFITAHNSETGGIPYTYEIKKKIKVTFDHNGGTGTLPAEQELFEGERATEPANYDGIKGAQIFNGWTLNGSLYDFSQPVAESITLKADWRDNVDAYQVNFDANGGTGTMSKQSIELDTEEKLSKNAFTRKGYTFTGWNTQADGKGTDYSDQQKVKNLSNQAGKTVTLFAQWKPISYQIKFDANHGTGSMSTQAMKYDQKEKLTKNTFTRSGYSFSGWNTQADGKGTTYADQADIENLTDQQGNIVTLYAQWESSSYTIKFDANSGIGSMTDQSAKLDEEETLTANTFTRNGYSFTGWNTQVDGKGDSYSDKEKVKNLTDQKGDTVILYAQWKVINYTLTYDSNGGGKVPNGSYTVEKGLDSLPTPTRNGYQFKNWLDEKNQIITKIEAGTIGNRTLKAQWQANTYEVKFDANGGTGLMTNQGFTYDQVAKLTKNSFVQSGHTFVGWNTQVDGKGTAFADQLEVKNLTDEHGKVITLYAQWKTNTYSIKFDSNGGTGTMNNQVLELDAEEKLSTNKFTHKGYTFAGWNTSADGKGTTYSDEAKVKNLADEQGKTITLFAQWKLVDYTVTYDCNGGEKVTDDTYTIEKGLDKLPTPTRNGYEFKYWLDEKDQVVTKIETGSTGNKTLKAQWQANSYEVKFDANGGTGSMTNQGLTYDQVAKLTKNSFVQPGHIFDGWNTQADGKGTTFTDQAEVKNLTDGQGKFITLFAQWKLVDYTVTYDSTGGEKVPDSSYSIKKGLDSLPTPTRKGYQFKNWLDEKDQVITKVEAGSTGNITLKAQWQANTYEVKFDANGGTGSMTNQGLTYDQSAKLTKNSLTRSGYVFSGWNTQADGKGTDFADQAEVKNLTDDQGKVVTLFAQWKTNTYGIKFDSNGGTGTMTDQVIELDAEEKLSTNEYTRKGYSFTGWNTSDDGKGKSYSDEAKVKNLSDEAGKTVTLYAQWKLIDYTIVYDSTGGEKVTDDTYTVKKGLDKLPTPTRKGYQFQNWLDEKNQVITKIETGTAGNRTLKAKWQANSYEVKFDANGGTGSMMNQSLTYDLSAKLTKNDFIRSNYIFKGWNTQRDGKGTNFADEAEIKNLTDEQGKVITLYAQWESNAYTVKFDSNAGTGSMTDQIVKLDEEDNLSENTYTRKGYEFTSWNTQADGKGKSYSNKSKIKNLTDQKGGTVILYAQWELIDYKVIYDSAGGEKITEGKYTIEKGIDNLPIPTRKGYAFENWLDEKDQVMTKIEKGQTGDRALKAKWQANTYEVKFDANSGTGAMANQSFTYDQAANLTANTFTRSGYVFTGWNTQSDGKGTAFTDQIEVKNLTYEQGKVVTLYAQWQANSYGIKFDANGGVGEMTDQILVIDVEESLAQNKFDRKGYGFTGWNTQADGNGTSYSDKEKIKNLSNQSGETVTLYAQWTANSYKVHFEANGGTGTMADQAFTYDASNELSENKYTRRGYVFLGWNMKADGTGQPYENQIAVSNLTEKPDETISLYAQWKLEEYTVKFESQGGPDIPQEIYTIEKGLAKLPSSSRKGYTFLGWFEGDKQVTKIPDDSTGDRVLTAKWELNTYTVIFEDGSSKPISYTVESDTFALPEKNKKGYQFQGWVAVSKNGEVPDKPLREISKGTAENYTLRASYQANRYQIQFDANQGTGKMMAQELLYDTPAKLTKNSFTREGYSFASWNTQKDGKGTEYKDQMEVKNLLSDPDGSITLYAQWKKQTSVLEDLVNQEKEKNRDKNDYTSDSWKDYEEALKKAQEALANPAASAEQLSEALDNLEQAIANIKQNTDSVILPETYWTSDATNKSYPTASVYTTERKSLPQTGSIIEPSFLFTGLLAVGASLAGWKRKQKK